MAGEDGTPEEIEARDEFWARSGGLGIEFDLGIRRPGVVEYLAQREGAGRGRDEATRVRTAFICRADE